MPETEDLPPVHPSDTCPCNYCQGRVPRRSPYYEQILDGLAHIGRIGYDPRHVEGYMRVEYGTLDNLSVWKFAEEIELACQCIDAGGKTDAEDLARSYGL